MDIMLDVVAKADVVMQLLFPQIRPTNDHTAHLPHPEARTVSRTTRQQTIHRLHTRQWSAMHPSSRYWCGPISW